jgi:hypothetical protein
MMDNKELVPLNRPVLSWIRRKLDIVATDEQSERELRASGWDDVTLQGSCFYWRIYLGPRWIGTGGWPTGTCRDAPGAGGG